MLIQSGNAPAFMRRISALWIRILQIQDGLSDDLDRNIGPTGYGLMGHINDAVPITELEKILKYVADLVVLSQRGVQDLRKYFSVHEIKIAPLRGCEASPLK